MKHVEGRVVVVIVDPWSCVLNNGFAVVQSPTIASIVEQSHVNEALLD